MADSKPVAQARAALGRQLAASRRAAGFSQEQLAHLCGGYSRSSVANAETGRQRSPRDFWIRCDTALGTGTALVRGYDEVEALRRRGNVDAAVVAQQARLAAGGHPATSDLPGDSDRDRLGDAPGSAGLEPLRLWLDGTLRDDTVNEAVLESWQQAVLRYGRASRSYPAAALVVELGADLAELGMVIKRCRSASSLRCLVRAAAQMSGLMCLMFVKLDDRDAFGRWAATARQAAAEAGDPATLSWVLAQQAYGQYYSGDLRRAVNVARHAQDLLRQAPLVGVVLAAALEARAHAARGDAAETRRALGRAEEVLGALEPGSVTASAFGYTESQFRFHQGNAYTRLRDVRPALAAQERALELCSPSDYTDWAMTRLDRANCLAQGGDAPAAVAYATQTLADLSAEQRRGIITSRGRELTLALPVKYRSVAAVREFEELLLEPAGTPKEISAG